MRLEFWFEFASTYSYPAAFRIERLASAAGAPVEWRPFLLGPIFQSQGWKDSPFNLYPVKGRYMWRDLERLCTRGGLPLRRPSQFPRNGLLPARVACLGSMEPWCADFTRRIYHANFADEEALDQLEANRDWCFVVPALGLAYQACHAGSEWGFTPERVRERGLLRQLEVSIETMGLMRKRGIRVLPGGDYGFAWNPHGTYARDLLLFVDVLGFTPMETLVAATRLGGEIMGRPDELGQIKPGYLADLLLVDGDPLADIKRLQDRDALLMIMKDGRLHKAPAS